MGCISWFGPGTVTAVDGNINAIKYQDILEDHLWPVIVQHFPQGGIFFKMIMPESLRKIECRLRNSKSYPVTHLACPITRSQYNRKLMAFNKKKTTCKEKQHKFIERIISRNSKNNTAVCAKFIHLHSLKNNAGDQIKRTSN